MCRMRAANSSRSTVSLESASDAAQHMQIPGNMSAHNACSTRTCGRVVLCSPAALTLDEFLDYGLREVYIPAAQCSCHLLCRQMP